MNHAFIDEHSEINSPIHRLDPRIKAVGFGLLILSVILMGDITLLGFALLVLMLAVLVVVSRVPMLFVVKRSLVIVPFSVMIAAFLPFMKAGTPMWGIETPLFSLNMTQEGLALFINVVVKSFLSVLSLILLTSTTRFPDLLKALEKMKCPYLIILILSFMYRYIFVVEDEFMKMRQAKLSRTVGGCWRREIITLANMVGVLFLRSYERAEAVYLAMCSRGFSGSIRSYHDFHLNGRDLVFLGVIMLSLAGIQYLNTFHG
jgi:cobalt/nickel transport system permease protein